MSEILVVASGYFDPLHCGHIEYLEKSKKLGDKLIVIVNNDKQTFNKKGFLFMPSRERVKILRELKCVDFAIESIDEGPSVTESIKILNPHIFTNGGDQFNDSIPEVKICKDMGIKLVDGLGEKIQSSRWILNKAKKSLLESETDYLDS